MNKRAWAHIHNRILFALVVRNQGENTIASDFTGVDGGVDACFGSLLLWKRGPTGRTLGFLFPAQRIRVGEGQPAGREPEPRHLDPCL